MSKTIKVAVATDGKVRHLDHGDVVVPGGVVTRRRASHIEPEFWLFRWFFYAIRRVVADDSKAAAWTRKWRVMWRCNLGLSGGGIYGGFRSRKSAIDFEERWLESRAFSGELCCVCGELLALSGVYYLGLQRVCRKCHDGKA